MAIHLHENIRHLIKVNGYTESSFKKKLRLSPFRYKAIMGNWGKIKLDEVVILALFFKVSCHEICFSNLGSSVVAVEECDATGA